MRSNSEVLKVMFEKWFNMTMYLLYGEVIQRVPPLRKRDDEDYAAHPSASAVGGQKSTDIIIG